MRRLLIAVSLLALICLAAACSGPQGPQGPMGPAGPPGPEGPQGQAGVSAPTVASPTEAPGNTASSRENTYIGDTTCNGCHSDIYKRYLLSGHPWILSRPEGNNRPDLPFTQLNKRPAGYNWEDFLFVVGGYNWNARFVDSEGYLITHAPDSPGDSAYLNKLNLPNVFLGKNETLVSHRAGEENLAYDCGACHNTGYNPVITNDLPGIVGTWVQDGVRCEECHGPGSRHASDPNQFDMRIERDAEDCNQCHKMNGVPPEAVGDQFIVHHDAYGDLFPGKHAVLDCVDCHDPHSGVVALRKAGERTTRAVCSDCHYQVAGLHKVPQHAAIGITCLDCHMPPIIQVAWGEPERFAADMRTHQVAINPNQIGQIVPDAKEMLPQVGLDFACRRCHLSNTAIARTDEELIQAANDYHQAQEPSDTPAAPVSP